MPSPEIVTPADMPFTDISKTTAQQVHYKKNLLENYLRPFVLLIAVYALIINRAMDAKKNSRQPEPSIEVKSGYTKAYVHESKTKTQNSFMFNPGMPVIFYPDFLIWK